MFSKEIKEFINRQLHSTAADLMLQASKYPQWNMKAVAQQLVGKKAAKKKLPDWFLNDNICYPVRLSMEQCSSQQTAQYKSKIINTGKGIDLTGGFGVDSYYLAKSTDSIIYCEQNKDLANIVANNFRVLNQENCSIFNGNGIEHLKTLSNLDWIYIDPARRKENQKVYRLEDCEPNVIDLKDLLFEKAHKILIKTSPLLDIQQTILDLKHVKEVHILSLNNECKEVLYLLEKSYYGDVQLICVNLKKEEDQCFSFMLNDEKNTMNQYSLPLNYLYEANSSIMKAGAFKSIGANYGLFKLHKHSHLYTSTKLVENFPGRSFHIKNTFQADKKAISKYCMGKSNLACRNYPQKVDVLKKKLKIKDGGADYIFATTLMDAKPKLILCTKIN